MLMLGEEMTFKVGDSPSIGVCTLIYLKYMGTGKNGLRMKGKFPSLWIKEEGEIKGPELLSDQFAFKAVDIDYNRNLIWLREMVISHENKPLSLWRESSFLNELVSLLA